MWHILAFWTNLALLQLLPFFHPVHLSMVEITQDKQSRQIEMSVTLFMDDFGKAIKYPQYEKQIQQGKMSAETLMQRYLQEKIQLRINGKPTTFNIRSTENNLNAVTCYLNLKPAIQDIRQLYIEDKVLLELFDDQRNMVQIQLNGQPAGAVQLDKKKTAVSLDF